MGDDAEDWRIKDARETYLAQRQHLLDLAVDQANAFDKAISLMASGALSLSAIFVNGLIAKGAPINGVWLFFGWGSLVMCLFANLFSYLTSWHDHQREILRLDDAYPDKVPERKVNGFAVTTGFLNWTAAIALGGGVIFLLIFLTQNLPGGVIG
jgi:hypothetical protein